MKNLYQPIDVILEDIKPETAAIKTFCFKTDGCLAFATGQFVELTVPGVGEAPFTPSSDPNIQDRMEITIMKAGRVTGILHELKGGETLGLRGPYGKGYPLEEFYGKEIVIVGGGVGLAPLRSLLFALFAQLDKFKKVVLRYGARSPADIVYKNLLPDWAKKIDCVVSVDVGSPEWKGNVGLVTTILNDLPVDPKAAKAIVCGPPIMMKFTTFKLLDRGFLPQNIHLSLEKNMSCGLGKCGHCRCGKYYVCKDGPVLTYDQVKDMWDLWD
ncbi:MAG: FAD/NAD(P)-binding protein [Candidatus Omnitrophota bacterium]